jgi:adenine phosphoribosyltransferase
MTENRQSLAHDRVDEAADSVRGLTRWCSDFPEPGIRFADLTPVFADTVAFTAVIDALAAVAADIDIVAGIDARGFLLAAGIARARGTGVLAIRKAGKLPPPVHTRSYALEYGTAALEIPADRIELAGKRALLVDDVLATGGSMAAAGELLTTAGVSVTAMAVVLELTALHGRNRLGGHTVTALVQV